METNETFQMIRNSAAYDPKIVALMYPLLVACKSISVLRRAAAQEVVDKIRHHSGVLVDQAQLVSKELIRVAILWHETWHEALEEASCLYFGEHNIEGMLAVLDPLHAMLEEGPDTLKETAFLQVEIKRTIPKGASSQPKDVKTKKIFVGGIPTTVTDDELKDFFSNYGNVVEHQVICDHATQRSRGFGFIIFDSEEAVDDLLSKGNMLDLAGA